MKIIIITLLFIGMKEVIQIIFDDENIDDDVNKVHTYGNNDKMQNQKSQREKIKNF